LFGDLFHAGDNLTVTYTLSILTPQILCFAFGRDIMSLKTIVIIERE
jgi:hypothetical protein